MSQIPHVCDGITKPSHSKGFRVSGEQIFAKPVMQFTCAFHTAAVSSADFTFPGWNTRTDHVAAPVLPYLQLKILWYLSYAKEGITASGICCCIGWWCLEQARLPRSQIPHVGHQGHTGTHTYIQPPAHHKLQIAILNDPFLHRSHLPYIITHDPASGSDWWSLRFTSHWAKKHACFKWFVLPLISFPALF